MMTTIRQLLGRLRNAQDGVAMIEFAYSMVVITPLFMGGVELANYITTRMRVSQLALHVADNASRIGTSSLLTKPQINEGQINDLLIGADMQSGELDLAANGRVILSSVEAIADPNPSNRYKIRWQRCYGAKTWPSSYGAAGDTNLTAVGPANKQVTTPASTGVMFVEVAYTYQPLFLRTNLFSTMNIRETAAMVIRDDRDLAGPSGAGVYPTSGVTASTC